MKDTIKFCPGAIHGRRGWIPVVRLLKNDKPVGSKTGPAMADREAAVAHAVRAANSVAANICEPFADSTEFVVAIPAYRAPAAPDDREVTPLSTPLFEMLKRQNGAVEGTRVLQVSI